MTMLVVEKQLDMFADEKQAIAQARIYADAAHRWILTDAKRFLEISDVFLTLAYRGAPIQQGRLHAEVAKLHKQLSDDTMFANNRNNYMALSRYLRAFYPMLKEHIRIKRSWTDEITLKAVPFGYFLPGAQCQNRPVTRRDWE